MREESSEPMTSEPSHSFTAQTTEPGQEPPATSGRRSPNLNTASLRRRARATSDIELGPRAASRKAGYAGKPAVQQIRLQESRRKAG